MDGALNEALSSVLATARILLVFNGCRLYRLSAKANDALGCATWSATKDHRGPTLGFALNTKELGPSAGAYAGVAAATNCTRAVECVAMSAEPAWTEAACAREFTQFRSSDGRPKALPPTDRDERPGFGGVFGPRPLPSESPLREIVTRPDWSSEPTVTERHACGLAGLGDCNGPEDGEGPDSDDEDVAESEAESVFDDLFVTEEPSDDVVSLERRRLSSLIDPGSGPLTCPMPDGWAPELRVSEKKAKAFLDFRRAKTASRVPFRRLSMTYRVVASLAMPDGEVPEEAAKARLEALIMRALELI
jgi:hypothetical protein